MSTSKLHKGQPILTFLAPTCANTASFRQPTECPFHHPTACRMLSVIWNGFRQWFAASPLVGNMFLIVSLGDEKMDIIEIIPSIQTEMLFFRRASDHDGKDKVVDRPFIMLIGAGNMHRQRRAPFVNQDMNLGAAFTPVSGIASSSFSAQRRLNRFAVDGLPLPANSPLPIVETNHCLQNLVPDTLLLPGLEPFVQNAARNAEPITMDGFPLAARPQNVPEAVDDRTIVGTWASWASFLRRLGQMLLDATPQWAWNTEIIDMLWLCVTLIFVNDTPRWNRFFRKDNFPRGVPFFQVNLFFG